MSDTGYYKDGNSTNYPVGASSVNGFWSNNQQRYITYNGEEKATFGSDPSFSGSISYPDYDLYKNLVDDWVTMIEDCDRDCQKGGSGITVIAILMSTMYSLIMCNACCMCCGLFDWRNRAFSLYCTYFNCLFQLIITIVACVIMFRPFNAICGRSVYEVGPMEWTMADDFYVTGSGLISSFILMICFCCCGSNNGMKPM